MNSKKTWIADLWERKVPQYLGTYLAVGFGLLQFVEFVTKRYDFSGYLVDKYLLVWLILLPAIATLVYFGGQLNPPTTSGLLKWPKFLVIGNVALAFLLGGFLFNGEATDQSEVIEITDEEGKIVKAVVEQRLNS